MRREEGRREEDRREGRKEEKGNREGREEEKGGNGGRREGREERRLWIDYKTYSRFLLETMQQVRQHKTIERKKE